MKKIRIGLLGLGQVGGGVYRILKQKSHQLEKTTGVRLEVVKVLVRNLRKKRLVSVPKSKLTRNPNDILRDPSIDVVVELTGGIRPTESWYLEAFKNGKDIVTANKALLAEKGEKLFKVAKNQGRQIFFEASVAGGVPVIKSLREGLIANHIKEFGGIINGTSNYILTQMSQAGMDFKEALRLAQDKGFAEADPTFDIQGVDAAHKLAILIRLAFGQPILLKDLSCRGITSITQADIEFASRFGYVIKLIAGAKKVGSKVFASVEPVLLKHDHMLAKVDGAFNAVLFQGDEVGDILLYGQGAGSRPTASAVINDLCDLAAGSQSKLPPVKKGKVLGVGAGLESRYYLRFSVTDKPRVLAQIADCLGRQGVSIADVIQVEKKRGNSVPLIMVTHSAKEANVDKALEKINKFKSVFKNGQKIRIED
jgi:homoserine dehydrogenase